MTFFLTGGYTRDGGGEASGVGILGDDGFLGTVADTASPSWLLRSGDRLYAVGESAGTVHSWRFDGAALVADDQVEAGGEIPCHLTLVPGALLVSCYGDGVLTRVPLAADGSPAGAGEVVLRAEGSGPHPDQTGARIHSSLVRPDGTILAADLGSDAVHVIREGGAASAWSVPAGTGPRDLALLEDGRLLVLGELSNSLIVLNAEGRLLHETALPGVEEGDHAAALALDRRDGSTRVWTGLRGSNRIAVVDVPDDGDPTGVLSAPTGGEWPRHLVLDGGALRIANQLSSTVTVLDAGSLEPVETPQAVPTPSFLLPVPDEWTALVR